VTSQLSALLNVTATGDPSVIGGSERQGDDPGD
jgi:hypothetical protein